MRITNLTVENCPSFMAAFHAANVAEAFEKAETALMVDKQHAAVWIRDPLPVSVLFNAVSEKAYEKFVVSHGHENFFMRDEQFSYGRSAITEALNPDEQAIAEYTGLSCERLIKRIQVHTPKKSVEPHFDGWSNFRDLDKDDMHFLPGCRLGGRRTRLLLTQAGLGPMLYERPGEISIKPSMAFDDDGYLANVGDLKQAWQAPENSLTFLTRVREWGGQAILHGSPDVSATNSHPRRQTLFDVNF